MKEEFKKYLAMILAVFCTAALSILFFFILFRLEALRSGTKKVLDILMPFIYGAGIAYILKPICNTYERFLEKHWHPKRQQLIGTVSVVGSVVTGLVIIYAVLAMLLPQLAVSISRMARSLPQMVDSISSMVDRLFEGNEIIQNYIMQLSDAGTESISGWLKDSILPYMNMILTGLSDSMINAAGIFMNLFIGLVVAIYLLSGRKKFKKQGKLILYSLFKERWANKIVEEIRFADRVFSGFIGGKLLDSAIIGVICYAGMMVLGLPYAILISVIVGVTNIIPFFGPYIGAIPSAILILLAEPKMGIYFIIFIIALQQFDGNVLGPKILGDSTGLSAFWVVFSILIGGGLFGVPGMILGVPTFAVVYYIVGMLVNNKLEKKKLRVRTDAYDEYSYVESDGTYVHADKNIFKEKER